MWSHGENKWAMEITIFNVTWSIKGHGTFYAPLFKDYLPILGNVKSRKVTIRKQNW